LLLLLLKQQQNIKSKGIQHHWKTVYCLKGEDNIALKGATAINIKSVLFTPGPLSMSQERPDCVNVTYWWSYSFWDLVKAPKYVVSTKDYFLFTNTPVTGNCCQI